MENDYSIIRNNFFGLRISGINYESMTDGDGIRTAIYFSGCPHHCDGCHNPETWNPEAGTLVTRELISTIAAEVYKRRDFLSGITITGGDPFYNIKGINEFMMKFKDRLRMVGLKDEVTCDWNTWYYTGFSISDVVNNVQKKHPNLIVPGDFVVDGRFEKDKADRTLKFRGSSNQGIYRYEGMTPFSQRDNAFAYVWDDMLQSKDWRNME